MLQTRSSIQLVAVTNTQAGGSAVVITNSSNIFITNTAITVNIINSAGWVVSIANTVAGGDIVAISNSAGWVMAQSNTSPLVQVQNSAGWIVNVANTANNTVIVNNSGGLFAQQSGPWTVAVSNTGGSVVVSNTQTSINIINSAGWIMAQSNTSPLVQVQNSAGWIMAQSNTAGLTAFALDSAAIGSVVTAIASTVGVVTLAASQVKRVALSIYNASTNPLFMKFGASASTASYTLMMVGSGYFEMARPIYNGIVTGIWQTANGSAYITETT